MRLGYLELTGEEPRRAVVAWEMLTSGNFLVPQAYGLEYYNKPPLYTWILALFMWLFGTSEFVVRIPGIISFLGIGLVLFRWLRSSTSALPSILPALLFLTSADLIFYATIFPAEIDLTFTLMLCIQAIGVYKIGRQPNETSGYWLAYIMLMAATLTKGFIALHFHFFTLIAWATYNKQFRNLFNYKHAASIIGVLAALGIYYFSYSQSGNLTNLLLNNFIESGTKIPSSTLSSIVNQMTECPFVILKISLPWTILLFYYFKGNLRKHIKSDPVLIFSVLYILANIWVYWIFIDVRDRYLYPFIPFICILIAAVIDYKGWWRFRKKTILGIMGIIVILRIAFNLVAFPRYVSGTWSDDYIYRELTDSLVAASKGNKIDLLMSPVTYDLPFTYNGISGIDRQPLLPYQIPYYLINKTKHAPVVMKKTIRGNYYLILEEEQDIIQKNEIVYSFTEQWYKKKIVMIRAK